VVELAGGFAGVVTGGAVADVPEPDVPDDDDVPVPVDGEVVVPVDGGLVVEEDDPVPVGRLEPVDMREAPGTVPVPQPMSIVPVAIATDALIPCRDFFQRITLLS
jgi:hypothetical protein